MTDAETLENISKVKRIYFDMQKFSEGITLILVIDNPNL